MKNENQYDGLFKLNAEKYGYDWLLLKAQVKQESAFNPQAVNKSSGAMGLAQFMKPTWTEWAGKLRKPDADPFNPEDAIFFQAAYMQWLKKQVSMILKDVHKKFTIEWALAAYNWGIGRVLSLINVNGEFPLHQKNMPRETWDYVNKIQQHYRVYITSKEK